MRKTWLMFAVLALASNCSAQLGRDFTSPAEVVRLLDHGSDSEKQDVALALIIGHALYDECGSKVVSAKLGSDEYSILHRTCGFDFVDFVVLARTPNQRWKYSDSRSFTTNHGKFVVNWASLVESASEEAMIHGYSVDHGTGVDQFDLLILKLINGHLKPVLEVPESGYIDLGWVGQRVEQKSVVTATKHDNRHGPQLHEVQTVRSNGVTVQLTREFWWSPEQQQFIASQWYSLKRLTR